MPRLSKDDETNVENARRLLEERAAIRRAKEEKRKAEEAHYNEQLERGNSNIGNGAPRRKRKNTRRPFRWGS